MSEDSTINLVTALWFGSVGACLGSFLNVVAYRLPLGRSVVWHASRCPQCGHAIRAWHNIPVFGWLWLRGRCYDCRSPISPRYALIEALLGGALIALAYVELYSGGANLPGGPLTRADDALDLFLRPCWPLIGIFAAHGTLIGILTCAALLHYDRLVAPPQLAVAGMLLAISIEAWLPMALSDPWGQASNRASTGVAQADGMYGTAVGLPLLAFGAARLWNRRDPGRWLNGALAIGTVGGTMGVKASLFALAVWCVTLGGRWSLASVATAVGALLLFWNRVHRW